METRQVTLKPKGRKPPELGPKVLAESVHMSPGPDDPSLARLINTSGLDDVDKDGLPELGTAATNMWLNACDPGLKLEFEFSEPVPLAAMELWNYNAEWQTTSGLRKVDIAVSTDGATWQSVMPGAEIAEAEGTPDYDQPAVLQFKAVTARKVRFENIVPWSGSKIGLSKVVFHKEAASAGPSKLRLTGQ